MILLLLCSIGLLLMVGIAAIDEGREARRDARARNPRNQAHRL